MIDGLKIRYRDIHEASRVEPQGQEVGIQQISPLNPNGRHLINVR